MQTKNNAWNCDVCGDRHSEGEDSFCCVETSYSCDWDACVSCMQIAAGPEAITAHAAARAALVAEERAKAAQESSERLAKAQARLVLPASHRKCSACPRSLQEGHVEYCETLATVLGNFESVMTQFGATAASMRPLFEARLAGNIDELHAQYTAAFDAGFCCPRCRASASAANHTQ
jgi:hypothetical protein